MSDRKNLDRNAADVVAYEGGSFRDRPKGKGIYHCMPSNALRRLSQRYEYGHIKYGDSAAYKDGLPVSDCLDSIFRHLVSYMDGDNSEDHLAAIAWGCFAIMYYEEEKPRWQDLKNRKKYTKGKGSFNYIEKYIEEQMREDDHEN